MNGDQMAIDKEQERIIEELYIDMFYKLSAYAQSALNDRLLAEEAVQDTFQTACAEVDKFLTSENPKGWLVNVLKRKIWNIYRSRSRLNKLVNTSIDIDDIIIIDRLKNTYENNMDLLYADLAISEDYQLLKKIALEKYSMLEAATELGISVEACKKRVQRAKKKLQNYFRE